MQKVREEALVHCVHLGKTQSKKGIVCAQRLTCFLFLAENKGVCAMTVLPQKSYWAICGGFGVKKDKI